MKMRADIADPESTISCVGLQKVMHINVFVFIGEDLLPDSDVIAISLADPGTERVAASRGCPEGVEFYIVEVVVFPGVLGDGSSSSGFVLGGALRLRIGVLGVHA